MFRQMNKQTSSIGLKALKLLSTLFRKAACGGAVHLRHAFLFSSPEVNSGCGFQLGNHSPPKKGRRAKPALRSKVMKPVSQALPRYENNFVYTLSSADQMVCIAFLLQKTS